MELHALVHTLTHMATIPFPPRLTRAPCQKAGEHWPKGRKYVLWNNLFDVNKLGNQQESANGAQLFYE